MSDEFVECCYATRHRGEHHPHPVTGRLVCHICHPPAAILKERAMRQAKV